MLGHMNTNHSLVNLVESKTSWLALFVQVNHGIVNKDHSTFAV